MWNFLLYWKDYLGHKYLEGTVRTYIIHGSPHSAENPPKPFHCSSNGTLAWPSQVYLSLQHHPTGQPLPLHLLLSPPAFPLLSVLLLTYPASLRASLSIKLLGPKCSFFTSLLDARHLEFLLFVVYLLLVYFHYTISIIKSKITSCSSFYHQDLSDS